MVLVLAALAGIATFFMMLRHDPSQMSRNPSGSPPGQGESPKSRISGEERPPQALSSPVSLQELAAFVYEGFHTSAQRDDFVTRQLNRSVVWEGWVGNVSSEVDGTFTVILRPSRERMPGLGWLTFAPAYRSDMLNLSPGQMIKVRGTFTKFDGQFFTLANCASLIEERHCRAPVVGAALRSQARPGTGSGNSALLLP